MSNKEKAQTKTKCDRQRVIESKQKQVKTGQAQASVTGIKHRQVKQRARRSSETESTQEQWNKEQAQTLIAGSISSKSRLFFSYSLRSKSENQCRFYSHSIRQQLLKRTMKSCILDMLHSKCRVADYVAAIHARFASNPFTLLQQSESRLPLQLCPLIKQPE